MLLAYVDESGDVGLRAARGSLTYTLGCVLIDDGHWPAALDELINFRMRLRSTFGLPSRAEVKASSLISGSDDLRPLGLAPVQRSLIYRAHMRVLATLHARAFAVVVDKRIDPAAEADCFNLAWEGLFQRLERTSTHEAARFMLLHDEGQNESVRAWARRARHSLTAGSAYGIGSYSRPAALLIDDPSPRASHQSYFIQLADLVAYAAFRSYVPSTHSTPICPPSMWTEIGTATHSAVNMYARRAAPGIVVRP